MASDMPDLTRETTVGYLAVAHHAGALKAYFGQGSLDGEDLEDIQDRAEAIVRWSKRHRNARSTGVEANG